MIALMLRSLLILLSLTLAACAQVPQAPEWRLADASELREGQFVILTVAQEDPEALSALAETLAREYGVTLAAEWPLNAISVHCFVFDTSNVASSEALIGAMERDNRIRTVQRMQDFTTSAVTYSDPLFPMQSALGAMSAPLAHEASLGTGIRVGVVDTAIDVLHGDLRDRVDSNHDFVATTPGTLAEGHGTAVAGIIAASADNALGIVGVAPEARLVGLRACWQGPGRGGRCNSFSLARAINFAILNDIDVLNLSLGGGDDALLRELIEAAIAQNVVVVAASGERRATTFPASMSGVIAAGGGRGGRIPAPMTDILTTAPGERHRFASGSSIATAHVSGVVALMLEERSGLSASEVSAALESAIDQDRTVPVLNACAAVLAVGSQQIGC